MDVDGFRSKGFRRLSDARRVIQATASADDSGMSVVREVARTSPLERASAAQMLVKRFDGEGLSTPRHHVPPIPPLALSTQAEGKAPAAANPSMAYQQAESAAPNRLCPRELANPPKLASGRS
jgi:hypothetical protein